MTETILSSRQLNRALLARQLLLDRWQGPLGGALEQVGGIQTQYAPSAYIGLWSRVRGFRRDDLTRELEQRRAAQGTLMRSTIHTVSAADHPLLAAGIRRGRREWWLRLSRGLDATQMERAAQTLRVQLASGPARAGELKAILASSGLAATWAGVGPWLDMVRVPPSGTWEQRRADLYALAESWLEVSGADEAGGLEHLVRRYLGGFGPASANDIAGWAGIPVAHVLGAVGRLQLRSFRDERGKQLLDLPGGLLPAAGTPAPVRFLPAWDATLLVHARRTLILPEAYRPLVFTTRTPHSVGTFLVDGTVAGSWRWERGAVRLQPFAPLPPATTRELGEEAARLAAFHTD